MKPYRRLLLALLRISIGWVFLWAFLDKLLGLGYATCRVDGSIDFLCSKAWLSGGSPTAGFLLHGTSGPLAPLFKAIQGVVVDWLFMIGLLGIGVALILGVGMRVASYSGALLLLLMFTAVPPTHNPVMDDHIIYAIVLVLLRWMNAGHYYGLGEWWEKHEFVKKYPWLD
jgi:thiosulfate dehydrogenase (quinone) large subunit